MRSFPRQQSFLASLPVKFPAEQVKPCLFWQPQPPALHLGIRPDAALGPAGNPLQRVAAAFWAAASKTGDRTWSSWSAGTF